MTTDHSTASRAYTILAPGFAKWRGSDGRALANALRRFGHNILEIDEEDYVPWRPQGTFARIQRRLFGNVWARDYNRAVLSQAINSWFDFVLVYKGNFLTARTVERLQELGKPVYNFYPDVSFRDHGPNIPASMKFYDCVFTTKSYHGAREQSQFGIKEFVHVRHGFDPQVHRPVAISADVLAHYGCDVSFVGCWSPEKEKTILTLRKRLKGIDLRVYGNGWHYASSEFKRLIGENLRSGVYGDELAIVYSCSKINLGLLSVAKSDSSIKDQTTARTFQIPATRSFMIHEDTKEVRSLFKQHEEIVLFNGDEELVDKTQHALQNTQFRKGVADSAFRRCQNEPYDYSSAANAILNSVNCASERHRAIPGSRNKGNPEFVRSETEVELLPS